MINLKYIVYIYIGIYTKYYVIITKYTNNKGK